jgi:hypothetical protein
MYVTIERDGGFTGITKLAVLNTATLSRADSAKVQALVEDAGLLKPGALVGPAPGKDLSQPDRFRYTVTVVADDGTAQTLGFDESRLPVGVRELVELARERK